MPSNVHPLNGEQVHFNHTGMNGLAPDAGLFGGVQFAYQTPQFLNPFPQAYPAMDMTPLMHGIASDSSYPSTRNNSVTTSMTAPSLTSQADNDGVLHGLITAYENSLRPTEPSDVIREADMNGNMPSDEIVWANHHDDFIGGAPH